MNINELFEEIQDEYIPEELNGEYLLQGNCIVWTYDLDDDAEEIDNFDEDEDNPFNFEALSVEELLLEAYREDFEKLQELLDENEETGNWSFSDTDVVENIISYKIF